MITPPRLVPPACCADDRRPRMSQRARPRCRAAGVQTGCSQIRQERREARSNGRASGVGGTVSGRKLMLSGVHELAARFRPRYVTFYRVVGSMLRSGFIVAGASIVAGCAGSHSVLPVGKSRRTSFEQYSTPDGGTGGGVPPTPNPIDPDSGLKIIGGTRARYDTINDQYDMMAEYGPYGPYRQSIWVDRDHLIASLKKCPATVVATLADATAFVAAMWTTFGSRLSVALGAVSFTSLSVWEAVGVALAVIPGTEIILAGVATAGLLATLYEAYLCVGGPE
ncbi:MAG: hypothetical protein QOJ39_451 [Candidatus Eremiobacteraeota bacterium]|jgi:hypothetical protein|nr:hypothetical protein [Candidatus Eremiobacteraeota bacterium]